MYGNYIPNGGSDQDEENSTNLPTSFDIEAICKKHKPSLGRGLTSSSKDVINKPTRLNFGMSETKVSTAARRIGSNARLMHRQFEQNMEAIEKEEGRTNTKGIFSSLLKPVPLSTNRVSRPESPEERSADSGSFSVEEKRISTNPRHDLHNLEDSNVTAGHGESQGNISRLLFSLTSMKLNTPGGENSTVPHARSALHHALAHETGQTYPQETPYSQKHGSFLRERRMDFSAQKASEGTLNLHSLRTSFRRNQHDLSRDHSSIIREEVDGVEHSSVHSNKENMIPARDLRTSEPHKNPSHHLSSTDFHPPTRNASSASHVDNSYSTLTHPSTDSLQSRVLSDSRLESKLPQDAADATHPETAGGHLTSSARDSTSTSYPTLRSYLQRSTSATKQLGSSLVQDVLQCSGLSSTGTANDSRVKSGHTASAGDEAKEAKSGSGDRGRMLADEILPASVNSSSNVGVEAGRGAGALTADKASVCHQQRPRAHSVEVRTPTRHASSSSHAHSGVGSDSVKAEFLAPSTAGAEARGRSRGTTKDLPPLPSCQPSVGLGQSPMGRSASVDSLLPPPISRQLEPAREAPVITVNNRQYKVTKVIGKGGSSRVFEVWDIDRLITLAVKQVDLSDADEAQATGFINEINLLRKLQDSDKVIKLFDFQKIDREHLLYVVMEKGETDLASLLKSYSKNNGKLPNFRIQHFWLEMLEAVAVIHKNGIIHSDLKPANFLLVSGRLKLIDFGIASCVQSDKTSVTQDHQMGTFNFMSPETIQDLSDHQVDSNGQRKPCIKISYKSDVWSLGCILYNMAYGRTPFGHIKMPVMKLQAILNPAHQINFSEEGILPLILDVLKLCLNRNPKERPSIQELLQHPLVK